MANVSLSPGAQYRINSTGEVITVGANESTSVNPAKVTILSTGSGSSSSGSSSSSTSTSTPTSSTGTSSPNNSQLNTILGGTQLSPEEKQAITSVYNAIANNNDQEAQRLLANLQLGAQYADPILKQQVAMMTDELQRGFQNTSEDQAYSEKVLQNRLNDIRTTVTNQKDNLTLDEQAQLRALERNYQDQLSSTQDSLASVGFTASSRRAKKEQVMAAQQGDLVQSTSRGFAAQQTALSNQLSQEERDYQLEVDRLKQLTQRGQLDLARNAEQNLGTNRVTALPELAGIKPVGTSAVPIAGTADLNYRDQISNFIF